MVLGCVAVCVLGVTFLVGAAGWWSYATGAIALAGAILLGYFGYRNIVLSTKK
ncbi:hypothetical protein SAMN04489745_0183 [Arthrobacter woluwensis]|uniref:Uncharacterized protein n=1 Tax=Arthrobacter woluwensis TaxID=156980 RepID=A0A1H4JHN9_9MICC|nr:hypothetical protein SAMN04489745_0183 [Arthrobacter woluwensis]